VQRLCTARFFEGNAVDTNIKSLRALILDMDGVLWRDNQPIVDLPAAFTKIRNLGLKFSLATNNATLSVSQYVRKLAQFGLEITADQIINSSEATAHYLKKQFPEGGPVFIVGEEGLIDTLAQQGFYHQEKDAIAVIAGMDRQLTYEKLGKATLIIRAGAIFVGTNPDRSFPTPKGLMPGAGSILAALESASDVKPIIIGKPEPGLYQVLLERMQVGAEETLVIGDRLETDIAGAQKMGCKTALVLSGVTDRKAAYEWKPEPDYIEKDLAELIDRL
jgi:4-nitrophenyl phosphatase